MMNIGQRTSKNATNVRNPNFLKRKNSVSIHSTHPKNDGNHFYPKRFLMDKANHHFFSNTYYVPKAF